MYNISIPKFNRKEATIISFLLFGSIFVFVYCLIKQIQLQKIKKRYVFTNRITYTPNRNKNYNSKILRNIISKMQKKEIKLNNLGNPYNLNGKTFYMLKFILLIFFLILSLICNLSVISTLITSTISFFLIDILIFLNEKSLYSNIQKDLINVVDNVYLQLASNVNMDKILRNLSTSCKTPVLRYAFVSMSNVYEYTGFNMQTAVLELKNRFNISEVDMFCNALVEQNLLGENLPLIENLSNMLVQKNIEQIKLDTKKKVMLITVGIVITLLNITLLVFYPIMNSFSQGFSSIFS